MYSLSSQKTQSWLIWFLRGVLMLGFLVLFGRLIDLQLIRGNYFRSLSEGNRIRRVSIKAPRGDILARGGEVLVGNSDVIKKVEFGVNEGFTKTEVSTPNDNTITEPRRIYNLGSSFAHGSGYVGEVNQEELGKVKGECTQKGVRRLGDSIGRTGLEKQYDCELFGLNGEVLFEVDAKGKTARKLGVKDPTPGTDIRTTIDYDMQATVSTLLEGLRGAIIVTTPDGEILSIYSSPSFDPNSFVGGNDTSISAILNDKTLPLFNRVLGGNYHPGSVYKPLIALAALEEGAIEPNYTFTDTGQVVIKNIYGTYSYKNWYFIQYGGVEGSVGIERALARSTDTFFYKVGELMGIDSVVSWSHKFGLDKKTGIDLPGEISGLVPSPEWKLDYKGERWFLGDTYNVSIGQGDLAVTTVEVNTAIAAIANKGFLCEPHLRFSEESSCVDLELNQGNLGIITRGMEDVCTSGGTAYPFFDFYDKSGVKVACKTGTAQNIGEDPHAWFVAFGPSEKPEIIVTVLVENGGEGSAVAAPIARKIFNYYFNTPDTVSLTPTPTPN